MPSFEPVRALSRGLAILQFISETKNASLAEVTKYTKLPHATVVRLVETLVASGYLIREKTTGRFSVSGRTLLLSSGYDAFQRLSIIAEPSLSRFHREVGWPLNLAIFDQDAMVIVHTKRRRNAFALEISPGSRSPLLVTGIGKSYLAHCTENEIAEVLETLKVSSNKWDVLAHEDTTVKELLEAVREQGYALSSRDYVADVYEDAIWAVAVPIFVNSRPYGSVSALVLRNSANEIQEAPRLAKLLTSISTEIGNLVEADLD